MRHHSSGPGGFNRRHRDRCDRYNNGVTAYVALGSNLGDRPAHLRRALEALEQAGERVRAESSVWETEPVDAPGTPWFLNMVVELDTRRAPHALLSLLLEIEAQAGRRRGKPNAPRTLDLDLLAMDDLRLADPRLELPHPRMWERRFVLEPLAEIAPGLRNPRTGRTVDEERRRLAASARVANVGPLAAPRGVPL
jgi:2-amino-4-hydroxy-6-hydroxymethyldihydropteridine diphosphokinase